MSPDSNARRPRIVVLDHYDSFVHNLSRYLRIAGAETVVHRADRITASQILDDGPDGVLLSPGPKGPSQTPVANELVLRSGFSLPILGVCLGHQAIAAAIGASVVVGPPMHGMAETITHDGEGVFQNCPSPLDVARYHSLRVDAAGLPEGWSVTATGGDGVVMGIRHRDGWVEGVQFHPESILTQHGQTMINNFVECCRRRSMTRSGRNEKFDSIRPNEAMSCDGLSASAVVNTNPAAESLR